MSENQLLRLKNAAKALSLNKDTFIKRGYEADKIIDGVKFFDIERLKAIKFVDKRYKEKTNVDL